MEVIEIAREIMENLGVFKGSKPVVNNAEAMIIKGMTHKRLEKEEIVPTIEELYKKMNIKRVYLESKSARTITDRIDKKFRKVTEVYDQPNGIEGIERLKNTFEMTGFIADYVIGITEDDIAVYVVMWMDNTGFGPRFVETMVVQLDPENENENTF